MIKIKTLTEALLTAFVIRLLIKGASLGDSYVVASLCGAWAYSWYLETLKIVDPSVELRKRLDIVEEKSKQFDARFQAQAMTGRK